MKEVEQTPFTEETKSVKALRPHQKLPITVQEFSDSMNSVKAEALNQIASMLLNGKHQPSPELGLLIMQLRASAEVYAKSETPSERIMELSQYDLSKQ